jgi:hypothetical protein
VIAALSPAQREKLAKLLGMLGSNHSGERDAAGLAAHRLVFGAGMTWFDVLTPQVEHHRPEPDDEPGYAKRANSTAWQQAVEMYLGYPNLLSQWEQQFLRDI